MIYESELKEIITEDESLWDRISFFRFKEIIANARTEILKVERSTNNFGNFLFITLRYKRKHITFFGFGLHEARNQYYYNSLSFYTGNDWMYKDMEPISKIDALKIINVEYEKYKRLSKKEKPIPNETFCLLADMADEDGALSLLEDYGGEIDG